MQLKLEYILLAAILIIGAIQAINSGFAGMRAKAVILSTKSSIPSCNSAINRIDCIVDVITNSSSKRSK